jgi:hypothetical protein
MLKAMVCGGREMPMQNQGTPDVCNTRKTHRFGYNWI